MRYTDFTVEETVTIEMARSEVDHAYFTTRTAGFTLQARFDAAPNDWQDSAEGQELQDVIDVIDDAAHKLKNAFLNVPEAELF